jgi:hypothetical protein
MVTSCSTPTGSRSTAETNPGSNAHDRAAETDRLVRTTPPAGDLADGLWQVLDQRRLTISESPLQGPPHVRHRDTALFGPQPSSS